MSCSTHGRFCSIHFEILGSGPDAEKLKGRLSCALGLTADIRVRADLMRALDLGATRDPVIVANGTLLAQGLPRTEELELILRELIDQSDATAANLTCASTHLPPHLSS